MNTALIPARLLVKAILQNAHNYEWSLQGLGMLRLYIPGTNARMHIWDTRFAFPGASPIHDHLQWGLRSTIISGRLVNYRFCEGWGDQLYHFQRIKAGFGTQQLGQPEAMFLKRGPAEVYLPGDTYSQAPNEVHETVPDIGTVTIMEKFPTPDGDTARIFWPVGTKWGSAEPRPATDEEVADIANTALELMEKQ